MEHRKENRLREIKHKVLEVLEGGLRGNTAARIFSWTLIVLIVLSIVFMIIGDMEQLEPFVETFEIIETITIGIFTLELILGFWTADIRYADAPRPRLKYMTSFMTIIQILAILPFYLGLILQNTDYMEYAEYFQLLKLLHLLKIGEIGIHAAKEKKEEKKENSDEENEENSSSLSE